MTDPQPLDDDGPPLTTIRLDLAEWTRRGEHLINRSGISFPGGQVIRGDRDAEVTMPPNVTVVHGAFALPPQGSRKHPEIGPVDGIVLEVRDLPLDRLTRFLWDLRRRDQLEAVQVVDPTWRDLAAIREEIFYLERRLDTLRAVLAVRVVAADDPAEPLMVWSANTDDPPN